VSKGGGSSRTSASYSNEAMGLQQLLLNNLMGLYSSTGGLGMFGMPQPQMFWSPQEQQWSDEIQKYARYGTDMGMVPSLYTPEEYRANVLGAFDTQAGAASQYLNTIASPAIVNQLTAAGMGRSGAVGESLGNAATQMALPLSQQRAAWEMNYPTYFNQLNNANFALLGAGQQAAGQERNAMLQDFMRRQNLMTSMLPLTSAGFQPSGQTTTQGGSKGGGLMSSLLPLALMIGMAPMSGGTSLFGMIPGALGMGGGSGGMAGGSLGTTQTMNDMLLPMYMGA
jgi:hypothetical protein